MSSCYSHRQNPALSQTWASRLSQWRARIVRIAGWRARTLCIGGWRARILRIAGWRSASSALLGGAAGGRGGKGGRGQRGGAEGKRCGAGLRHPPPPDLEGTDGAGARGGRERPARRSRRRNATGIRRLDTLLVEVPGTQFIFDIPRRISHCHTLNISRVLPPIKCPSLLSSHPVPLLDFQREVDLSELLEADGAERLDRGLCE